MNVSTEARPTYQVVVFVDLPDQPRQWVKTWPDPSNRGQREYTTDRSQAQVYTSRSGSSAAQYNATLRFPDAEVGRSLAAGSMEDL